MESTVLTAGCLYATIGYLSAPLYFRIIWVLLTHDNFRRQKCYFLLTQVGILDCLFSLGQATFGICILTNNDNLTAVMEYVVIPLFAAGWLAMIALNLVLSVNRLIVVCSAPLPRQTENVLMVGSWLFGMFFLVSYASRYSPLIVVDRLYIFYDLKLPYAYVVQNCELYGSMTLLGATFLIYVCVLASLIHRRISFSGTKRSISNTDIRLLIQAVITFVLGAVLEISWNYGDRLLPDSPWSSIVTNVVFIFACGWLNPALCLLLNGKLRKAVFAHCKRKAKVSFVRAVSQYPSSTKNPHL
ncbi:hypothetical protein L596_020700 [Steinernema carpocapsae]|uniref:G-protein coupled receptors family 1 profile domain-containing protein n=1 Tax=Steinernema carpocapsae TaxID=34508 RepID=A0A4U5MUB3_STECR|nr:hypothetical protein L596_020700 [Steinernema carpocapsae]